MGTEKDVVYVLNRLRHSSSKIFTSLWVDHLNPSFKEVISNFDSDPEYANELKAFFSKIINEVDVAGKRFLSVVDEVILRCASLTDGVESAPLYFNDEEAGAYVDALEKQQAADAEFIDNLKYSDVIEELRRAEHIQDTNTPFLLGDRYGTADEFAEKLSGYCLPESVWVNIKVREADFTNLAYAEGKLNKVIGWWQTKAQNFTAKTSRKVKNVTKATKDWFGVDLSSGSPGNLVFPKRVKFNGKRGEATLRDYTTGSLSCGDSSKDRFLVRMPKGTPAVYVGGGREPKLVFPHKIPIHSIRYYSLNPVVVVAQARPQQTEASSNP